MWVDQTRDIMIVWILLKFCHWCFKGSIDFELSITFELGLDEAMLGANEWYFFSFRDHKYATGVRANRMTKSGYWKATGKDRPVFDPTTHKIVGMRKTLVFYLERAPNGKKTGWVMHEFRLESLHMPPKVYICLLFTFSFRCISWNSMFLKLRACLVGRRFWNLRNSCWENFRVFSCYILQILHMLLHQYGILNFLGLKWHFHTIKTY